MKEISQDNINYIYANYHLSVAEICIKLEIGKGTASKYLSEARAKFETLEEREARIQKFRNRGLQASLKRKSENNSFAIVKAREIFTENINDIRFHIGLSLYWAEGTKKRLAFTNSDPAMIRGFVKWVNDYLPVDHLNLAIDVAQNNDENNCKEFWGSQINLIKFKLVRYYKSNRNLRTINGVAKVEIALNMYGAKDLILTLLQLEKEYFDPGV